MGDLNPMIRLGEGYALMSPIQPMLAGPLLDPKKVREGRTVETELARCAGYASEIKLDGNRRIMGRTDAWSRPRGPAKGLIWNLQKHPLWQRWIPPGWLLDGEIGPRTGPWLANEVGSQLSHDQENMKLVVFDVLYAGGKSVMSDPWEERRELLEQLFDMGDASWHEWFELSKVYDDPQKAMETAAEMGHEGVMLKNRRGRYVPGSRADWVKWKFTETFDVVITDCDAKPTQWTVKPGHVGSDGVLYPEGKRSTTYEAGVVGLSYGFWDAKRGAVRKVGALGITGPKEQMQKYVGTCMEVKSFGGQYPTGALRHPTVELPLEKSIRHDKAPENCEFSFGD